MTRMYKIRYPNGRFSRGGAYAGVYMDIKRKTSPVGKTWSSLRALSLHLTMVGKPGYPKGTKVVVLAVSEESECDVDTFKE